MTSAALPKTLSLAATLAALALLVSPLPARSAPAPDPRFVATELPATAPGRQTAWLLEAAARLPLAAAELREHFSAEFLAQPPTTPAAINRVLAQVAGPDGLQLAGVVASDPRGLVAVLTGRGQELVLTIVVSAGGRVVFSTLQGLPTRSVTLPRPTGPAAVGTDVVQLRDAARGRVLMLTRWYPAAPGAAAYPRAAYASPRVAAALALPRVRVQARLEAPALAGRLPVVLFSPGGGVSRVEYTVLAEALASRGYLVVAVDHTGEAPVELANGRLVLAAWGAPAPRDPIAAAAARRLADMRFVLRRLPTLPKGPRPDLGRIAAVGHSLGGSTAAALLLTEPRVRAGVDLDGTIFGPAAKRGVPRPFLVLTEGGADASIRSLIGHSSGPTLALNVGGFVHMSFSDLPVLYPGAPGLGRYASPRDLALQSAYVRAFLDRELLGRPAPLLEGPSTRFPQVTVVARGRAARR